MLYHLPLSSPLPPLEPPRTYGVPSNMAYRYERPGWVTVLALLNFFTGGLTILLLMAVAAGPQYTFHPRLEWVPGFFYALRVTAAAGPIFLGVVGAIISLMLAIGLWTLQQWARVMALIVYIGGVVITLYANWNDAITGSVLVSITLGVAAAIYLVQPEVRRAFAGPPIDNA